MAQNEVTIELVSQEFYAVYSAAAADAVFSSSSEYDGLRTVICVECDIVFTACYVCVA